MCRRERAYLNEEFQFNFFKNIQKNKIIDWGINSWQIIFTDIEIRAFALPI